MGRYEDILKRNEQLIDNVYEMNEEITDLAYENEGLTRENEDLVMDNEELSEQNANMREGIAELHKKTARRYGNRRRSVYQPYNTCNCNHGHNEVCNHGHNEVCNCNHEKNEVYSYNHGHHEHRTISLFISNKTKQNMLFGTLIFLILLLGLGIEPGVALNYESILDCFLELIFNLYKLCILGGIGFCLRKLWKRK